MQISPLDLKFQRKNMKDETAAIWWRQIRESVESVELQNILLVFIKST